MKYTFRAFLISRPYRWAALAIAVAGVFITEAPADAQLSRVGSTLSAITPGGVIRGTDVAFDPVNGVYLVVTGNGPVYGVFVNVSGQPVTAQFTVSNDGNWAHFPRVEYSPHATNGAGGQGAFLVTWVQNVGVPNYVYGRLVSYAAPTRLVSAAQLLSDGAEGGVWHEAGPGIAYSATSQRFLVVWRTVFYGIQGRFVANSGLPTGSVVPFENAGGSRDPSVAWNPATDQFGLVYTGFGGSGALVSFRRIRASDGANLGRTSFGFSGATFATGIDVNSSNEYVLAWSLHPGTMSTRFDASGNQVGASSGTLVSSLFGWDQSLGISYNGTSKSVLAVGSGTQSYEIVGAEMNSAGDPITTGQVLTNGATPVGSNYPMTAARSGARQWNVAYSQNFNTAANQIMSSGSDGAAPPAPAPTPTPTPTPAPAPSACATADPFAAIGGGTCCNGGWLPPGLGCASSPAPTPTPAPAPAPAPAPTPSTCSTPNPFASLGGGTCCNGGWLPPGLACASSPAPAPAPAPAPPTAGCSTPDPFGSIGGGVCVNGGWVPASGFGCVGSDPFTSIGGGQCINGGWVPR